MRVNAKIVKTFPQSPTLKAIANITIEDCFVVHGVRVINSEKGLFVAMPSFSVNSKDNPQEKQYKDICHPINSETRQLLTDIVLEAYSQFAPSIQS